MQNNNNTSKIKIQGANSKKIRDEKIVKATVQGKNYIEILETARPVNPTIRKINKKQYMVLSTGELKNFQEKEVTEKSKDNLKKTFTKLRQLIRTNFTSNSSNQLFITLTYKENMTDEKRLYNDFKKFFQRLQYRLKKHKLDYIVVMEPQERGAWHVHLMLKSDQPILYIDNKELTKIWGFGFTETKRLKSNDVGTYYVSYFTDIIPNEENVPDKEKSKKRQKGERLKNYPKNFKFYRTSRGIKKPKEMYIKYGKLKEYGYKKTYEKACNLIDEDDDRIINTIQRETWKK